MPLDIYSSAFTNPIFACMRYHVHTILKQGANKNIQLTEWAKKLHILENREHAEKCVLSIL